MSCRGLSIVFPVHNEYLIYFLACMMHLLSSRYGLVSCSTRSYCPNGAGRFLMKVQLIVVQGKPEGKTIPLQGPIFKIGRGETCHLRPNSEQVSREHSE